jgi:hypothetical protein
LIENGQRHTWHGHHAPKPSDPCYREAKSSTGATYGYCRYLYPRVIRIADEDKHGVVLGDPHRHDLRNLFLERNDSLINNFEEHLLLINLGNIDWRALINLWSVLDYLTKYTAKSGKSSQTLGKMFEEVLDNIFKYELEDNMTDLWRRAIMKFYSRILGDRDYSLFEVVHFWHSIAGSVIFF